MSHHARGISKLYFRAVGALQKFDGIGPLLLRLYLAPIFIIAGSNKLASFSDTAAWFGNPDWGLGLPFPELLAGLAIAAEIGGGIALLVGLGTRLAALPLMITMIVAAATVHWDKGWHALPESTLTMPWEWRVDLIEDAQVRKERAVDILRENSNYDWITSAGSFTVLKNGIEFAATYFVMCLVLLFTGGGRFVSLDYWIARKLSQSD